MRLFCLETIHKGEGEYHPRSRVNAALFVEALTLESWLLIAACCAGLEPQGRGPAGLTARGDYPDKDF